MNMVKTKKNPSTLGASSVIVTIIMILLCVICLIPVYILIVNATRTSVDITGNGVSLIPNLHLFENIATLNDWPASGRVE